MKSFLLFFFLLFSYKGYTQNFKVTATSQGWAGGICCRSGVNYNVTVSTGKLNIDSVKVLSVCVDTKRFTSSTLTVNKSKNSFTVSFGYSVDGKKEIGDIDETDKTNKSDNYKPCDENLIIFKLNGEIFSLNIEQIIQLEYIAYP